MPKLDNTKLIEKLREKKHRTQRGLFLVEGEKSILEVLASDFTVEYLALTDEFYRKNRSLIDASKVKSSVLADGEIKKLSTLENNMSGIAIVKQKENSEPVVKEGLVLALDGIRDPGNFGTIVRIADWYGVKQIIASEDSTDMYNPKAINSSMGSFTRVDVSYANLFSFLSKTSLPILGTYLDGENVHTTRFPKSGILIIGNESHGVSDHIKHLVKRKLTIPNFGQAESLNAAVACAIVLDNWKRSI